ncbi:helix-turn-helix domain-containing protein [Egibacter rhizosphaerae]|uniref:helix-turn-helix domain-containing protein n=1 Tax=Egibacter rhizosphaerae TaxID=1670831 RepID=UPI00197A85F4|nr:helix-turn-helix domain-containing protein [Egibacter rhizosphaerae]
MVGSEGSVEHEPRGLAPPSGEPVDARGHAAAEAWHPVLVSVAPLVTALDGSLYDGRGTCLLGPDEPGGREIPLVYEGQPVGRVRLPEERRIPPLHDALGQLLDELADRHGGPLDALSRTQKQEVVAELDSRGAFVLRKAVEDVAARLGVSRFTVYNYLAAASGEDGGRTGSGVDGGREAGR